MKKSPDSLHSVLADCLESQQKLKIKKKYVDAAGCIYYSVSSAPVGGAPAGSDRESGGIADGERDTGRGTAELQRSGLQARFAGAGALQTQRERQVPYVYWRLGKNRQPAALSLWTPGARGERP